MNNPHDPNRDLEQELVEALEDFRQGIADPEQIKLLAWSTCVSDILLARINKGEGRHL